MPPIATKAGERRMLTIWGRATSSNVQKVLWCCDELGLAVERIDAGREFGKLDEPPYRAMNPNGLVPTLVDGSVIVWESNAILRYLCNRYGGERLYPADPAARSAIDQWLDWQLTTLAPAIGPVFWALVRTPESERDSKALAGQVERLGQTWALLDRELANRTHVAGETLSIADLAYGNSLRRWYAFALDRPDLPHLAAWYRRLGQRPGFQTHVMTPVV
jgi:glutathione S-transferase